MSGIKFPHVTQAQTVRGSAAPNAPRAPGRKAVDPFDPFGQALTRTKDQTNEKDGTGRIAAQDHAGRAVHPGENQSQVEVNRALMHKTKCAGPAEVAEPESPDSEWTDLCGWWFDGPKTLKTDEGCDGFTWNEVCTEMTRWVKLIKMGEPGGAYLLTEEHFRRYLAEQRRLAGLPIDKLLERSLEKLQLFIEAAMKWNAGPTIQSQSERNANRPPNEYQWPSRMILYSEMVQNDDGEWVGVGPGLEVNIEDGETLRDALHRIAQPYREPSATFSKWEDPILRDPGIVFLEDWMTTISRLVKQGIPEQQQETASA